MTNTTKTTIIGAVEAAVIAATDYSVHLGPDGVNLKAPTFWLGLVIAAARGLQGFYMQGTSAPPPASGK